MAREVLKDCPSDRGRYLYAFSCFKTNDFAEAEAALTLDGNRNPIKRLDDVVNGSHGIYLLGLIREMSEKREQAAQCFLKAFEKNPMIFTALEKFLSLSDNPQIQEVEKLVEIIKLKNSSENQGIMLNHSIYQDLEEFVKSQKENNAFGDISLKKPQDQGKKKNYAKMSSF